VNKKSRILIVDDEPLNIRLVERALRDHYELVIAENGYVAMKLFKQEPPDLIILDVMMPGLSGFEVCRVIKADEGLAEIPVIFLTAMDTVIGETKGLECGGIDYLAKPVNLDLLLLRVRNHLELAARNRLVREQRDQLAQRTAELEEALSRVRQLEGIIPICLQCKSIRNSSDTWQRLETYLADHTDARFSHGYCPECLAATLKGLTESPD
jgi:DNA-binding response OmpR family regulator